MAGFEASATVQETFHSDFSSLSPVQQTLAVDTTLVAAVEAVEASFAVVEVSNTVEAFAVVETSLIAVETTLVEAFVAAES